MSIDVLVMGASHMCAMEVLPRYNASNVLASLSGKKIYNIGMGGHGFATCAGNLEAAVRKYRPSEYVVIESYVVGLDDETLQEIISRSVPKMKRNFTVNSDEAGFLRSLYRKYVRDVVHKILANSYKYSISFSMLARKFYDFFANPFNPPEIITVENPSNPTLLSQALKQMAKTVEASGAKLIIAYHPSIKIEDDGKLTIKIDPDAVKIFEDVCEANGIYFVNMSERFSREYKESYTLSNGFFNTSIGFGHLNKAGHRMLAEEIFRTMLSHESLYNYREK